MQCPSQELLEGTLLYLDMDMHHLLVVVVDSFMPRFIWVQSGGCFS